MLQLPQEAPLTCHSLRSLSRRPRNDLTQSRTTLVDENDISSNDAGNLIDYSDNQIDKESEGSITGIDNSDIDDDDNNILNFLNKGFNDDDDISVTNDNKSPISYN